MTLGALPIAGILLLQLCCIGHTLKAQPRDLELPKCEANETPIRHSGFTLVYSESHEQSRWVAYELTKEECMGVVDRKDRFIPDPQVATGTSTNSDYKGSGFDKGHLAPAADMAWSAQSMEESFYFSNMSPQVPAFNRGIWKSLEEQCRAWAEENEKLIIVTGPVLKDSLPSIGSNEVSIPKLFFKVILDYCDPERKGIAFVIPNKGSTGALTNWVVSIDSVERLTGIDFFPQLPDDEERKLESISCVPCWSWNRTPEHKKPIETVQCSGTTQKGERCRNRTTSSDGRCQHHPLR